MIVLLYSDNSEYLCNIYLLRAGSYPYKDSFGSFFLFIKIRGPPLINLDLKNLN